MSSNELALQCASCFNESSTFCLNTLNLRCMKKYYDNMKSWTMGSNYYVKTFKYEHHMMSFNSIFCMPNYNYARFGTYKTIYSGKKDEKWHGNKGDFYWTYHK